MSKSLHFEKLPAHCYLIRGYDNVGDTEKAFAEREKYQRSGVLTIESYVAKVLGFTSQTEIKKSHIVELIEHVKSLEMKEIRIDRADKRRMPFAKYDSDSNEWVIKL